MRSLTTEEHAHFKDFGYVIVKGVLEDADFEGEKGPLSNQLVSFFFYLQSFCLNYFRVHVDACARVVAVCVGSMK